MKRERSVIYSRGNAGRNARAGCFSLYLHFLFELNEVCTQACEERGGGQGWRAMARSRKDILHLPIQSVAFSNFEMKEKKKKKHWEICVRKYHAKQQSTKKTPKENTKSLGGPGEAFLTHPPSASPPASCFFEPAMIDEMRVLDWAPQLAGQGQDAVLSSSLSFFLALSFSLFLVTEINGERNVVCSLCRCTSSSAPWGLPKSPSCYWALYFKYSKIYSVIEGVDCFVGSECGDML